VDTDSKLDDDLERVKLGSENGSFDSLGYVMVEDINAYDDDECVWVDIKGGDVCKSNESFEFVANPKSNTLLD
jgi:hypothetical protein